MLGLQVRSSGDNPTRGTGLLAEEVILTTLALATTIVRVGIRLVNRQAGWDDATISTAMVLRLISFCFTMVSLSEGNGRHEQHLQKHQIMEILKWTWGNEFLIFLTVCTIKISICLYIFRISAKRWLRWFLTVVMVGLVITNGSCDIILLAQCRPLRAFWDREAGTCWDVRIYNGFIYAAVGYSVVTDLICTTLPFIILWKVQISKGIKFSIGGLTSLGLIASGCAAARAALSVLNTSSDQTWTLVSIDYWAFAEANVGIIAANVALSRMVYLFLQRRYGFSFGMSRISTYWKKWSLLSQSKHQDKITPDSPPLIGHRARCEAGTPREAGSRNSTGVPLNNMNIKKETDVVVTNFRQSQAGSKDPWPLDSHNLDTQNYSIIV